MPSLNWAIWRTPLTVNAVRDGIPAQLGPAPGKLSAARPICLRLLVHCDLLAASRAARTAGSTKPTRIPMMEMTTSSSMSVKPHRPAKVVTPERKAYRDCRRLAFRQLT